MKVGFIGTGNMGGALAKAAAASSLSPELYLADFNVEKAKKLAHEIGGKQETNQVLCRECDLVFLGVKPQVLPELLLEIAPLVKERKNTLTLVSMAAGVSTEKIENALGEGISLIRIMPNTPVLLGEGVIVYTCKNTSDAQEEAFLRVMEKSGLVEKIEEGKIDAASALHGCGPAFVYLFIEALADGAVSCGLSRDAALRFAAATTSGAAQMVLQTGQHPGELKDAVCSPGGSTIQGVRALEEKGLRAAALAAVVASYQKTLELGK